MEISKYDQDIIGLITDSDAFHHGMETIMKCYEKYDRHEQAGGKISFSQTSKIISKIFSPKTRASFTRTIRAIVRTTTGLSADIVTAGVGGDVIVNSLFAVRSSTSLLGNLRTLSIELMSARDLFGQLFVFDFHKTVPIVSILTLDDGFRTFQNNFEKILFSYIRKHGTSSLRKIHQSILGIIDKITTVLADWIACLFPDTAGLAGEIAKSVLDYIVHNGYTYVYHLVSILPDNMQKMITNTFALKKLIKHAVVYLRNIIKKMDSSQFIKVIESLGLKVSDLIGSPILHKAISMGTKISNIGTKTLKLVPKMPSIPTIHLIPKAQNIIVYVIDKYVIPNINPSIDLFNQIFPLFLMFTLFIEKYPSLITKYPSIIKEERNVTKQMKRIKKKKRKKV